MGRRIGSVVFGTDLIVPRFNNARFQACSWTRLTKLLETDKHVIPRERPLRGQPVSGFGP